MSVRRRRKFRQPRLLRATLGVLAALACWAAAAPSAGAAAEWLAPETLATGFSGEVQQKLAGFGFSPRGDAVAAYPQADGHMIVRYRPAGGSWSSEDLGAGTANPVEAPAVAIGPDGTVALIVHGIGGSNQYRVIVRRAADGAWDPIRDIPDDFAGQSFAVGPHGEVAIVYTPHFDYHDRPTSVYERDAEGNWSRTAIDTQVNNAPSGVGFDAEGNLTAVWVRPGTTELPEDQVVTAGRPAGGEWPDPATAPPTQIATARPVGGARSEIAHFSLAVAPSGAALAVWADHERTNSTDLKVQAVRRTGPEEAWSDREEVDPSGPSLTYDSFLAVVVRGGVADDGSATVAWLPQGGDEARVTVADRGPADAAWTVAKVAAETYGSIDDRSRQMDLDVNGAGDAIVAWWRRSGDDPIQSAVRPAGELSWTTDVRARPTSGAFPEVWGIDVGLDEQGNGLLGWHGYYGPTVTAAGYDASGPRLSGFSAPDGLVDEELSFAVAASDVWGAVDADDVEWTFGDGGSGSGPAPTHAYGAAGNYSVSVQATDSRGLTTTRSTTVHVALPTNQPPTASFTVTPASAAVGEEINFDASASSDPDGSIETYEWDFDGDGVVDSADGSNVLSVGYAQAGTYAVSLRVRDDRGDWSESVTRTVTIEAPAPSGGEPTPGDGGGSPGAVQATPPSPPPAGPPSPAQPGPSTGLAVTKPVFRVLSASRVRELPDVVGTQVDQARERLDRVAYVRYEIAWQHNKPRGSQAAVGEVLDQSPAGGRRRESAVGNLLRVKLGVYAGPRAAAKGCPAGFKQALDGSDPDLGFDLIRAAKCVQLDDLDFRLGGGAEPRIEEVAYGKAHRDGREIDLTVEVPRKPARHDLFLVFSEFKPGNLHTFTDHWTLLGGKSSCFRVQVFDRDHALIENAEVRLDLAAVGGSAPGRVLTDADGEVKYCTPRVGAVRPQHAGLIDVVAFATGRNGETVFGAGQIAVAGSSATYRTPSGRVVVAKTGRYATASASASALPRATASGWLDSLVGVLHGVWTQIATPFAQLGQGIQAVVASIDGAYAQGGLSQAARTLGVVPGNLNPGRALTGSAGVIAAGAGNVIAAGGGNVIASGGGNVIAAGGGNVIASGALNLIQKTGGNVIAAGAGNVIASGAGNVIAAGGGNVIASGGGNVIAAGGGNFSVAGTARARLSTAPRRAAAAGSAATADGYRAAGVGSVLELPAGGHGATMPVAEGMILPSAGQFIVGVKDARKSDAVEIAPGMWVLIQHPAG